MSTRLRSRMQGVVEFLRLYRSKSNTTVGDPNALVAARPWQRIGSDDSKGWLSSWYMTRLAGPNFVQATSRGGTNAGGNGMGQNGTPPTPPSSIPSSPSSGRFPNWRMLVLGSVFSLLLAFWSPKWTTLLKIGGEAEVVMNEVEEAAEVVEKVAAVVEKVSEEVADALPNDNKIKAAALIVEHISQEAAKDAHMAQEIIHKIDTAKEDLEDVGKVVEPIIENIVHDDKSQKATQN